MIAGTPYQTPHQTSLCRTCASLTEAERKEELEARDKKELDRLARLPLTCDGCKAILSPRGPRWWVCRQCNAECPSHVHPPWAAS